MKDSREELINPVGYHLGDFFVVSLGNATGDAGEGVGVAAQGDGFADGVFEGVGIQEADDGLGDGALAFFSAALSMGMMIMKARKQAPVTIHAQLLERLYHGFS